MNCSLSKLDYASRSRPKSTFGPSYRRYSSKIDDRFHFCFFRKHATMIPVRLLPSSHIISTGRLDTSNTSFSAFTTNYASRSFPVCTVSSMELFRCVLNTCLKEMPQSSQNDFLFRSSAQPTPTAPKKPDCPTDTQSFEDEGAPETGSSNRPASYNGRYCCTPY